MKKILSIVAVLILCLFTFVGCGKEPDSVMADLPVVGNGGLAVAKGEYIYFVNGYTSKDSNLNKNKEGSITKTGIYRIKTTDCSYQIVGNTLYFNNGDVSVDSNGNLQNAELIISKVCGFENTALYIFGDYLYYTTPNNEVGSNNLPYVNDIDFCRATLDGKDNTKLGTVSIDVDNYSNSKVKFYKNGETVYFACFDGKNSLTVNKINDKDSEQILSVSNVSSIIFPTISENYRGQAVGKLDNVIFYLNGNELCSTTIGATTTKSLKTFETSATVQLIGNNRNKLYYQVTKNEIATIYYNTYETYFTDGDHEVTSGGSLFTSTNLIDGRDELITTTANKIYILNLSGQILKEFEVSSATILSSYNGTVFFTSGGSLYKLNPFDINAKTIKLVETFELESNIVNAFSISNEYVFYYKDTGDGNIYLERINYKNFSGESDSIMFFGSL